MKITLSFLFAFLSLFAHAQFDTTRPMQRINAFGYQYKNFRVDSTFRGPKDTFKLSVADTGAIAVIGRTPYVWNFSNGKLKWDTLAGGGTTIINEGGGGSVNLDTLRTLTDVTILNPGGTSAVIKSADSLHAGAMQAIDKRKLDKLDIYNSLLNRGILKEVTDFPEGITNDGIFGFQSGTVKFIRVKKGEVYAEEAGIEADGSDQTARLNAVFAHPKIKHIHFYYDGGGTIVIDGAVNIPAGKTLKFSPGTKFSTTATGSVTGGIYDVDDKTQIFTGTQNFTPEGFARGYIPPTAWGFFPNTGVNMTAPLQKAVNWGIASPTTKKILITQAGEYIVENLVIAKYDGGVNGGGEARQASVSIIGAANSMAQSVTFWNKNLNAATIHMQVVYGCDIENINFIGIGPDVENFAVADDTEWLAAVGGGTIRGNRKSPGQTAISIDNFRAIGAFNSTITSTADYYPGMDNWYTTTQYSGSTNISIINCTFGRMYVGVSQGLSGAANGEGIRINGGSGVFVAYTWVAGQLQSRENTVNNFYHIFGKVFVTNHLWGTGIGDIPSLNNVNVNFLKYIFTTAGNFTFPRMNVGYSESIHTIGVHYGSTPVSIDKWNLAILANGTGYGSRGLAPVLLEAPTASVTISNSNLYGVDYYTAFPFNVLSLRVQNSRIEGGIPINVNPDTYMDNIRLEGVSNWGAMGNNVRFDADRNETILNEGLFYSGDQTRLLPGNKITGIDKRTHERVGPMFDKIDINPPSQWDDQGNVIDVDYTNFKLTFTAVNPSVFRTGDVIYTSTLVNNPDDQMVAANAVLGYVENITGTTITLTSIPRGLTDGGTYRMFIVRLPRYVGRALGTVTTGSNIITNVINDAASFVAGDRIRGTGIIHGSYVTWVNGTDIHISTLATATATNVELYDAQIKVTAKDSYFKYVGGNYHYNSLSVIWFRGDELFPGDFSDGRVCLVAGKTGVVWPVWTVKVPYQNMGTNNDIFTSNMHYDGVRWVHTAAGTASMLQLEGGGLNIYGSANNSGNGWADMTNLFNLVPNAGPKFSTLASGGIRPIFGDATGLFYKGPEVPTLQVFLDSISAINSRINSTTVYIKNVAGDGDSLLINDGDTLRVARLKLIAGTGVTINKNITANGQIEFTINSTGGGGGAALTDVKLVPDADYTILATDGTIFLPDPTTQRTITLPGASTMPNQTIIIHCGANSIGEWILNGTFVQGPVIGPYTENFTNSGLAAGETIHLKSTDVGGTRKWVQLAPISAD